MSDSQYGPSFPSSGQPEYAAVPPPTGKRPGKLTAAVVISYVASGLALVGGVIVVAAAGSQEFIDAFADSTGGDVSTDELTAGLRVIFGAIAVLALLALVITPFVAKGAGWARIVLTVLGAVGLVACIFALPAGIIWMIAIITTIVLMFLSDSSAYFKSRSRA